MPPKKKRVKKLKLSPDVAKAVAEAFDPKSVDSVQKQIDELQKLLRRAKKDQEDDITSLKTRIELGETLKQRVKPVVTTKTMTTAAGKSKKSSPLPASALTQHQQQFQLSTNALVSVFDLPAGSKEFGFGPKGPDCTVGVLQYRLCDELTGLPIDVDSVPDSDAKKALIAAGKPGLYSFVKGFIHNTLQIDTFYSQQQQQAEGDSYIPTNEQDTRRLVIGPYYSLKALYDEKVPLLYQSFDDQDDYKDLPAAVGNLAKIHPRGEDAWRKRIKSRKDARQKRAADRKKEGSDYLSSDEEDDEGDEYDEEQDALDQIKEFLSIPQHPLKGQRDFGFNLSGGQKADRIDLTAPEELKRMSKCTIIGHPDHIQEHFGLDAGDFFWNNPWSSYGLSATFFECTTMDFNADGCKDCGWPTVATDCTIDPPSKKVQGVFLGHLDNLQLVAPNFAKGSPHLRSARIWGCHGVKRIGKNFLANCPKLWHFDVSGVSRNCRYIGENFLAGSGPDKDEEKRGSFVIYRSVELREFNSLVKIDNNFLMNSNMTCVLLDGMPNLQSIGAGFCHGSAALQVLIHDAPQLKSIGSDFLRDTQTRKALHLSILVTPVLVSIGENSCFHQKKKKVALHYTTDIPDATIKLFNELQGNEPEKMVVVGDPSERAKRFHEILGNGLEKWELSKGGGKSDDDGDDATAAGETEGQEDTTLQVKAGKRGRDANEDPED